MRSIWNFHRGVLFFLLFLVLPYFMVEAAKPAKIKFAIGKSELLPGGKTNWQPITVGMSVQQGDRLRTALNARIELEMPDGSVLKISENSVFDVKELKTQEEDREDRMSFTLWAGNLWASFKKVISGRQSREIETPSAVVAIRGTIIEMDVANDATTTVRVVEGKVSVKSRDAGGEVIVESNQQTTVQRGKKPTPPKAFSQDAQGQSPGTGDFVFEVNTAKLQITDPAVLSAGVLVEGRVSPGARLIANGKPLQVAPDGNFRGRVPVQEGLNAIKVTAELRGQRQTRTIRLFVNTKKPEIQISRPVTGRFTNRRNYSLSGAVFDATPMDKVKVYINDEMVIEINGRGSFNRTIILKEGKNNIVLRAVDRSGNVLERSEQIFLDTVKPIVTITQPAQEALIRFEPPPPPDRVTDFAKERFTQVIRGLIIDPHPSSTIKRFGINGKEIRPNSDGTFEAVINLRRGENRISIFAEDVAGNIYRDDSRKILIR
ncbi:MAG TPA: hypothetical protein EYP36_00730 [Calditrichaeota bacterium]|nr:hypothetical protein [Calditrichota bacterium]